MTLTLDRPATRRDWLSTGEEFLRAAYADAGRTFDLDRTRGRLDTACADLTWREPEGTAPMSIALALNETVQTLKLPNVQQVAYGAGFDYPDGPETATATLFAVEARYSNATIRAYFLDGGSQIIPVFADVWEAQP